MIRWDKPLNLLTLQKSLPKRLSATKERAKILFIHQIIKTYRENSELHEINFENSSFDGLEWKLTFYPSSSSAPLARVVEQIMSQWYFSNVPKNENVYFYRFINVFRALLDTDEWEQVHLLLSQSSDPILRENFAAYCGYRAKLEVIDRLIQERLSKSTPNVQI